ncbi:MAG: hypothetical protein LBU88_06485, partial [Treponema sp.]|nr:hypothetical protein [Treponema sp.]
MKLSRRLPILIGSIVLFTCAAIIIAVQIAVTNKMEASAFRELSAEARINSDLISTKIYSDLIQLREIANEESMRTMDWDTVRENLIPDIKRINAGDLALVYPDGTTYSVSVSTGSVGNMGDRDYVKAAFSGQMVVSDVLLDRLTNTPSLMLAVPVFQNDEPNAPVIGVVFARKDAYSTLDGMVNSIQFQTESGYAFMVNKEGVILAHPNQTLVNSMYNPIVEASNDPSYQSLADMLKEVITKNIGIGTYTYMNESKICAFSEVKGHNGWKLIATIERIDFEREIKQTVMIILLIGIISFLVSIGISILVGRIIA